MSPDSLKALRAKASLALRIGEFGDALRTYRELENAEPRSSVWPQRQAQAFMGLGKTDEQLAALQRAAEIAIDLGEVISAIAICKEILTIDPDQSEALDRLHLLYSEFPSPGVTAVEELAPIQVPDADAPQAGPLSELLLTEIVPGRQASKSGESNTSGICEISLDDLDDAPNSHQQLLETPLFGSLDAESIREVIHEVRLVELAEGEVLFRQGDLADTLYVVSEGAVVPIAEEDGRKKLAVLEAGSFFGEVGLITDQPRNATIQAIVDTKLLAIDRRSMWALIHKHPRVLRVLLKFFRDRMIDRLVRTSPFFAAFPTARRATVAKLFRFIEVQEDVVLIEQDRPTENLYALLTGQVEIVQSRDGDDRVLADLEPGDLFGEMSLLTGEPALASAIARGKCWVLALAGDRLHRLVEHNEELERVIAELAGSRREKNHQFPEAGAGGGGR